MELDPAQQPEDFQWLLWQGFDHGSDRSEFLRSDPIIPQRRPHLNRRLSLAAAAPDGTLAAYCCVWAHPDTDYAYVEPVCTAPAHRGKGLAAALLSEALTRSKALGAREAFVISDLPFYEKLGFEKTHHYIFYRKENEMNSCCMIRPERPEEHREVENLVREAFWNVYRPGCSEHYVLHVLRNDPAFVKELDFVMERDGRLIGQNMFMKTHIEADDGRLIPVLTMGPIGITPELKRQGYGKKLLDYSLEKAAELGFGAVLFEGNIGFYGKSGFTYARNFGIRYHDLPEGADDSFFLCKELIPGYLDAVTGVYQTPQGYYVDDADVEAFDRDFPSKEKLKLPGQLFG
ncbi:MAG: GNAT family N-acetyltransferase [Oscillospiraceae bacterium]|nr:GNAT family N-acetyltransferase [Oscillospiraceae bacterium]